MRKILVTILGRAIWSAAGRLWNWLKIRYEWHRQRILEERERYRRAREEREAESLAAEESIAQAGDAVMEEMSHAQTVGDKLENLAGHSVDYGDKPVLGRLRVRADGAVPGGGADADHPSPGGVSGRDDG